MDGLQLREAADLDALRELSLGWGDVSAGASPPPVYMHPDHLRLWLEKLAPDAGVRLVTAWTGNRCVGYAPFMVVPHRLGPVRSSVLRFVGNNIGLPGDLGYMDVWARDGDPAIVDRLLRHARSRWRASLWDLGFLPQGSPTTAAARRVLRTRSVPAEDASKLFLSMDLPESWDAYLAGLSAQTRQKYRKHQRRLEGLGKLEVRAHRDADGCAARVREMIRNHERWWSGTPREGWFGDRRVKDFLEAAARRLASRGEYLVFTLELDGRPVVWHAGAMTPGVHYAELISQDWSLAEWSPGTVLSFAMIHDLIDMGIRRLYLGPGADQRKRVLGGKPVEYVRVRGYLGLWRAAERLHHGWRAALLPRRAPSGGAEGARSG